MRGWLGRERDRANLLTTFADCRQSETIFHQQLSDGCVDTIRLAHCLYRQLSIRCGGEYRLSADETPSYSRRRSRLTGRWHASNSMWLTSVTGRCRPDGHRHIYHQPNHSVGCACSHDRDTGAEAEPQGHPDPYAAPETHRKAQPETDPYNTGTGTNRTRCTPWRVLLPAQ